jgi:hypothetical protein
MAGFIRSETLTRLIKKADPTGAMYCVLHDNQLELGTDPLKPTWNIDFATETVREESEGRVASTENHSISAPASSASRRSGTYKFEIGGKRYFNSSLKQLLHDALIAIERASPGTLDKLSTIKPYSKRIVARDPKLLFESAHLSDDFSEPLIDGWWYGTNNSAQEVRAWMERAANCAGLTWGSDIHMGG